MQNHLHIWDFEQRPQKLSKQLIFWRIYDDDIESIPNLIEKNSEALKARYLEWVYDIGTFQVNGKNLIDKLKIRDNFSFWWMTLISEKCNYSASPQITEAIKLMAFDMMMSDRKIDCLEFSSTDIALGKCLKIWCDKRGIRFTMNIHSLSKPKLSFMARAYAIMPDTIRAISQLCLYMFKRWPLRGVGLNEWKKTNGNITFFSYLFNLSPSFAEKGEFESGFWTALPEKLKEQDITTNWLHIFCEDTSHPKPRDAARIINQFNEKGSTSQIHVCLDSFLGFKLFFKTLVDWLRVVYLSRNLEKYVKNAMSKDIDLWPLYQNEWRASLFGANSIINLLTLNLLEVATKTLPSQKAGVYLYEQQPWELALIYAWKNTNHGQIIGAQHSTMLYWDMRYYHDPRTYYQIGKNCLPMPDLVATNGPEIMKNSILSGYPEDRLIEVEALRYLYLQDLVSTDVRDDNLKRRSLCLLIVGDYLFSNTDFQLKLLSNAISLIPKRLKIILKPHPNLDVNPSEYPKINMTVTKEPLLKILPSCDVVYASSVTSAAVDAYCAGKPVITSLNSNTLNLSPLRGRENTFFVSTPKQMVESFKIISRSNFTLKDKQEFFTLDKDLPRWKKLIAAKSI